MYVINVTIFFVKVICNRLRRLELRKPIQLRNAYAILCTIKGRISYVYLVTIELKILAKSSLIAHVEVIILLF